MLLFKLVNKNDRVAIVFDTASKLRRTVKNTKHSDRRVTKSYITGGQQYRVSTV